MELFNSSNLYLSSHVIILQALNKFISHSDYEKGDESKTDFSYALALVRRKYPQSNIRNRLLAERTNWKNHKGIHRKNAYITRTIEKAIAIVQNF